MTTALAWLDGVYLQLDQINLSLPFQGTGHEREKAHTQRPSRAGSHSSTG
jgi:hypothetical protein